VRELNQGRDTAYVMDKWCPPCCFCWWIGNYFGELR